MDRVEPSPQPSLPNFPTQSISLLRSCVCPYLTVFGHCTLSGGPSRTTYIHDERVGCGLATLRSSGIHKSMRGGKPGTGLASLIVSTPHLTTGTRLANSEAQSILTAPFDCERVLLGMLLGRECQKAWPEHRRG